MSGVTINAERVDVWADEWDDKDWAMLTAANRTCQGTAAKDGCLMSDAATFSDAFRAWYKPIRGWVYSVTSDYSLAEEIASETFVKAWKAWPNFKHERAVTRWLWKIARNLLADRGRFRHRHYFKELVDIDDAEGFVSPHDALAIAEVWADVETAWGHLTPEQRDALALYAVGFGQIEGSQQLGITPGAFRLRLHRGREVLTRCTR